MLNSRVYLGVGLLIGVLVTTCFFHFFAPRYEVINADGELVKQDRWSELSWVYKDNKWEKITEATKNWESVDQALTNALNIASTTPGETTSSSTGSSSKRMKDLREKYPVLQDLSDEEIENRIKNIYSKKILVDLYFNQVHEK